MYQVEDEPVETIHVYIVREGQKRPSLVPVIISVFVLSLLIALGVFTSFQQPEKRTTIRVPAILLPLRSFSTTVLVIATGTKTYPATHAHGTLTIYNGSILSQELPPGMILTGKDGVEVITDEAVAVPAGNPPAYGSASVSVHTVVPGRKGNIQAFDINQVYGTSLYIRNLQSFIGGQEAHTVMFITSQDRQNALFQARRTLIQRTLSGLLQSPCAEAVTGNQTLSVTWTCQFVTYHIPAYMHVTGVRVFGNMLLVDVVFVARPRPFPGK